MSDIYTKRLQVQLDHDYRLWSMLQARFRLNAKLGQPVDPDVLAEFCIANVSRTDIQWDKVRWSCLGAHVTNMLGKNFEDDFETRQAYVESMR